MSDLCLNAQVCGDIALPGQDLCAGCVADRQAERVLLDEQVRRLTDANERRLLSDEDLSLPLGVLVAEEVAQ